MSDNDHASDTGVGMLELRSDLQMPTDDEKRDDTDVKPTFLSSMKNDTKDNWSSQSPELQTAAEAASAVTDHLEHSSQIRDDMTSIRSGPSENVEIDQTSDQVMQKQKTNDFSTVQRVKKKAFVCDFCKKTFNSISHFKDHVRIHTGEKPYKCKLCGHAVIQKSHLRYHAQRLHPGFPFEQIIEKAECNKSANDKSKTSFVCE